MKPGNFATHTFFPLVTVVALVLGCDRHETPHEGDASKTPDTSPALVPLTNMVPVQAGSFIRMNHRVTVSQDFWLGKFEVTQAEYLALIDHNPSYFTNDLNRPVEKVSQADAAAYCAVLTKGERENGRLPAEYEYRLPSEAEWELACRAGSTNLFSFGNDEADADRYAWTEENSEGSTHPVGEKLPNPWGFFDIHGNVWEWCRDWFADYPASDVSDPIGPPSGKFKVFRGGGWNHEAQFARCPNRFMMPASNSIYFVGFRVALGRKAPPAK